MEDQHCQCICMTYFSQRDKKSTTFSHFTYRRADLLATPLITAASNLIKYSMIICTFDSRHLMFLAPFSLEVELIFDLFSMVDSKQNRLPLSEILSVFPLSVSFMRNCLLFLHHLVKNPTSVLIYTFSKNK